MNEVAGEPTILRAELEDAGNGIELLITEAYTPPADGLLDPYRGADLSLAREIGRILASKYYAYPWSVISNIAGGILAFQLPELMGPTLNVCIRIKDYNALNKELILDRAGNLLERMGLPCDRCDMDLYREAKARLHTFQFDDVGKRKRHA